MTRNEIVCTAVVVALGAGLVAAGSKRSPGASIKIPKYQGAPSFPPFTPPPNVPDPSVTHTGPYGLVYTPHRYPPAVGSDITAAIHRGYSVMSLPNEGDMTWLSAPPSEAEL